MHPAPTASFVAKEKKLESLQQQADALQREINDLETEMDAEAPPSRTVPYVLVNGRDEQTLGQSDHSRLSADLVDTYADVEIQLDEYEQPSKGRLLFNSETSMLDGQLVPPLPCKLSFSRCKCGHVRIRME